MDAANVPEGNPQVADGAGELRRVGPLLVELVGGRELVEARATGALAAVAQEVVGVLGVLGRQLVAVLGHA